MAAVVPLGPKGIDHRELSLKFLHATGLIPVKVRPGQKEPFPEWDPRSASKEDHTLTLAEIRRVKELNLGALFAGRYVDLDVDSNSPYLQSALDYFLPRTPYVWGRKSKPNSHRVYALHEDFDRGPWGTTLRYIKALTAGSIDEYSYSLELRGGKPENGLFSVLPGSIHPSKERVEWSNDLDPTVGGSYVELSRLVRAIRLALAASIVGPHWLPGTRNDLSLALAGTLWRIRTSTRAAYGLEINEDPDEANFVLSEDDAAGIFNCVMAIAGDESEDKRSRLLNLRNTWKKLDGEAGAKVTGGKVLAELIGVPVGPRVVRALYRLLSDNDAAEQIEKLAEQFVMWYGPGVIIDLEMVVKGRGQPWMNPFQSRASLGGKKLVIGDKKIPIHDMLFSTTICQRVFGLTFDPSNDDLLVQTPDGLQVNQWKGWGVQPCEQSVTSHEVEPFLSYLLEVVCDNDANRFEWVLSWMADMLQDPANKPGTALVLVGVQGAGKTFLGEHILGKIVGEAHYTQLKDISKLTDKFNTIIDNKIFVQCDEAIHSYQRDVASRLKSIITDRSVTIEPKGINAYSKPNHMHVLFTSNEETKALFIDPSPFERRFTVFKVSNKYARDMEYWSFMHMWTPSALPKIMRYLLDHKYDKRFISRPIETEAKREIQRDGVDLEVSWIISRMASGFPINDRLHQHWYEAYHTDTLLEADQKNDVRRRDRWPNSVLGAMIETDYKEFVRGQGRPVYSGSVAQTIKRILPPNSCNIRAQRTVRYLDSRTGQATQTRVRLSTWPSVAEILDHLRGKYGIMVDEMLSDAIQFPDTDLSEPAPQIEMERDF